MTRNALMITAATLVGLTVLGDRFSHSQPAQGQGTSPQPAATRPLTGQPPVPPSEAEQNLLDMQALADQGAKLKAETEAVIKSFDEKQEELERTSKDARMAQQNVDDMIKLLRSAGDRLGPEGAFVKILRQHQEYVRKLVAEAMTETGGQPFAEQLSSQDGQIGALREQVADLAAKLAGQIDRLERARTQIALAYAVTRTEKFIATARAYFEDARRLLQSVREINVQRDKIVAPTLETQ